MVKRICLAAVCLLVTTVPVWSSDLAADLQKGTVDLESAGPLAFGPEGILFVGDTQAASLVAIATGDTSGNREAVEVNVDKLDEQIAAALGTTPRNILVNDLAVNPISGNVYLSVSRGRGPEAAPVLLRVDGSGNLSEVSLKNVKHAKAELPNPPAADAKGRGNRSLRAQSITDLAYHEGQVLVAGLSNEEFASTLRSIPFPFQEVGSGTSIEVFHGAHGRFETHSPVRTFATYAIDDQPHLLAAYTCTPLVKFPLSELTPGKKVRGTTVAELGNRNRPLDMFVYEHEGDDYILMANSARGVMKIRTDGLARDEGITERIEETAGQSYETISELQGVVELDRLNDQHAVALIRTEEGELNLRTIALP